MNTLVRQTVSAILCSVAAIAAAPSYAQSSGSRAPMELNIPAQSLEDSLLELARQASVQLVISSGSLTQLSAPRITGTLRLNEALDRLLRNTDLGYKWTGEKTLMIAPKAAGMQTISMTTAGELAPTRLAQVDDAQDEVPSAATADSEPVIRLEEVIVTGSHIRGAQNLSSPVTVYTREDINRSGATSVADWLEKLPQNFGGGAAGASPDGAFGSGEERFLNSTGAVSPNLRGLGVGSTLTLVNGRRLAPSAGGGVVDIGMIPLGAIERVDIVADGASAIYGSDAVGGVVNIILRDRLDGIESALSYGSDDRGGYRDAEFVQSGGLSWNSGSALLSGQYSHKSDLKSAERRYSKHLDPFTTPEGTVIAGQLYPESEDYSLFSVVRQRVTEQTSLAIDSWFSHRDRDQTNVSSGILVSTPASVQQFVIGATMDSVWAGSWKISLPLNYSRTNEHFKEDYFMASMGHYHAAENWRDFEVKSAGLKADGSVFSMPAGEILVALGAESREEEYARRNLTAFGDSTMEAARRVNSAYLEAVVPIIDGNVVRPELDRLSLSLSARHDDYSDVGSATTWKVGVVWRPLDNWSLRSSLGTAFRAPTLQWSQTAGEYYLVTVDDAFVSPTDDGFSPAVLINGTRALGPENSRSFSIGFDYARPEGITLGGTYFLYDYQDRLASPPWDATLLRQPDVYGSLFSRVASVDQVEDLIAATLAAGGLNLMDSAVPLDDYQYVVDMRYQNIAEQRVSGVDLNGRYAFAWGEKAVSSGINATYIREDNRRLTKRSTAVDMVDKFGEQAALRARYDVSVSGGVYDVTLAASYVSSMRNQNVVPSGRVDDWLTFDLTATYRLQRKTLKDSAITFSVQNLFNEDPPYVYRNSAPYYDPANANPIGRFTSLKFVHKW